MAVVVVCAVLTGLGMASAIRWGGSRFPDPPDGHPALVYLWYLTVAITSGLAAGVTLAGAGGRLVMRLLAATSPAAAQGRVTEADQAVGRITVDGTIGFVVFTALFFGAASGIVFLLIRQWLPRGRWAGVTYGTLLLVLFATRVEPLRSGNEDFDIVGPSGVALAAFGALVLVHGMAVAAFAARYARALPLIRREARVLVRYAPLLPMLLVLPVVLLFFLSGLVFIAAQSTPAAREALRSRRALMVGRVVLAVVTLVALPGFVAAVTDIAGRGP